MQISGRDSYGSLTLYASLNLFRKFHILTTMRFNKPNIAVFLHYGLPCIFDGVRSFDSVIHRLPTLRFNDKLIVVLFIAQDTLLLL